MKRIRKMPQATSVLQDLIIPLREEKIARSVVGIEPREYTISLLMHRIIMIIQSVLIVTIIKKGLKKRFKEILIIK